MDDKPGNEVLAIGVVSFEMSFFEDIFFFNICFCYTHLVSILETGFI